MINIRVFVSQEDFHTVSDFNIEKWYSNMLKSTPHGGSVYVGTGVMLDRVRLGHKEEEVFIEAVIFEEEIIFVTEDSQLHHWPQGMFDQWEGILARLAGWVRDE